MIAIIPVAGIGTRLRPQTHTQPKALVPVAGKPILGHIVDNLVEGGIKEFVFIIGYLGSKVQSYINTNYQNKDLTIEFVIQQPREGIGHALFMAKEQIKNANEILIMLGDTILDINLEEIFTNPYSVLGIKKVDRPGDFGVAEINHDGFIKKLVEKPKIPKSNLALVGIYKITNIPLFLEAMEYIMLNKIKTYGEYQLTDILMNMIDKGERMVTIPVDNWYDCGKKESLLSANAILLNKPEFQDQSKYDFEKTIIIPPVSIGNNCKISNSIIGPYVAIGENSIVNYSIIKNSIIGSFSELQFNVLDNSIIGNDSSLKGLSQSLNIGDNTEIYFTS